MNLQNLDDALAINSGVAPNLIDQPGVISKLLLSLDFRIRHYLGLNTSWNLDEFAKNPNILAEFSPLINIGRVHSRILVIIFILSAALYGYSVTRSLFCSGLIATLLCSSSGLLFHGLLTRPELLCVGFGAILAFAFTTQGINSTSWHKKLLFLYIAGVFSGLSALSKMPGIIYILMCFAYCVVLPLIKRATTQSQNVTKPGFWGTSIPVWGGISALYLLQILSAQHHTVNPVAVFRFNTLAVVTALMPLLVLWPSVHPAWNYMQERTRELSLLMGGMLISLPLTYLVLRTSMPPATANDYTLRIIHYTFDPAPTLSMLINSPSFVTVFLSYVSTNLVCFFFAISMATLAFCITSVSKQLKIQIGLLLLSGIGMILIMSKRHYTVHYEIFFQVPLALSTALSFYALSYWAREKYSLSSWVHYGTALCTVLAFCAVVFSSPRLSLKYTQFQDDATLPVNHFTLTFLYDHDAHTSKYLSIMRSHYHTRTHFSDALEYFLAEKENRY